MFMLIRLLFSSWRAFFTGTFIISLLALLWKFAVELILRLLGFALSLLASVTGPDSIVVEYTGLAAYFVYHFKIAECLTVIFSAVILKFILRKIPFIGW